MNNSYVRPFNYCQWGIRVGADEGSIQNEYVLIQYTLL